MALKFKAWLHSSESHGYILCGILLIFMLPAYWYTKHEQDKAYHKALNAIYVSQLASCARGTASRKYTADLSISVNLLQGVTEDFLETARTARRQGAKDPLASIITRATNERTIRAYTQRLELLKKHPVKPAPSPVVCINVIPDPNHLNALATKEKVK